jgi:hypothetical protein
LHDLLILAITIVKRRMTDQYRQIVDRTQRPTGKRFQFVGRGIHERALTALVEQDLAGAADRRGRTDEKPEGRTDSRFGNRKEAEALVNAYMASWLQQDTDLFASGAARGGYRQGMHRRGHRGQGRAKPVVPSVA